MAKFLQLTLTEGKSDAEALSLLPQFLSPPPAPMPAPVVCAALTIDEELDRVQQRLRMQPLPYSPPFGPSPVPGGLP